MCSTLMCPGALPCRDAEDSTLRKMRQAAERQRLIEELQREEGAAA